MRRADPELLGVIGHPIAHSLSPGIHAEAARADGRSVAYHAFDVEPEALGAAIRGLVALGARGANLTVPHKVAGAQLMDRLEPEAAATGSVNTITIAVDGTLIGATSDVEGVLVAVREDLRLEVPGLRVAVVGSGGAARAAVFAFVQAGAASVGVLARSEVRAAELVRGIGGHLVRSPDDLGTVDLVVQATSVGMVGGPDPGGSAVPDWLLERAGAALDLVYRPAVTPLIQAARRRGIPAANGLTMLAAQARGSYRRWFGEAPELSIFLDAARRAAASDR